MIKKLAENPLLQSEPPWNWTGVDVLNFKNEDARLRELVAMFPSKRSSDQAIAAYLADLGARFQRWLHQDEFGPDRRQRTATLRALMKSFQRVERHMIAGSSLIKGRLDAELRNRNNPSNLVMQALYEAAVDVAGDQRGAVAPDRDAVWVSRRRDCTFTLLAQSQSIDSNTDSEIFFVAQRRRYDPLQAGIQVPLPLMEYESVKGAAVSKNASSILTWGGNTARLWDAATGTQIGPPLDHGTGGDVSVMGAAFSRNESRILTWSSRGRNLPKFAQLWNPVTGAQIGPRLVYGEEGDRFGAAFSKDESRILTWGGYMAQQFDVRWTVWRGSNAVLVKDVCAAKLIGRLRNIDTTDIQAAPILRGREREDVCASHGFLSLLLGAFSLEN